MKEQDCSDTNVSQAICTGSRLFLCLAKAQQSLSRPARQDLCAALPRVASHPPTTQSTSTCCWCAAAAAAALGTSLPGNRQTHTRRRGKLYDASKQGLIPNPQKSSQEGFCRPHLRVLPLEILPDPVRQQQANVIACKGSEEADHTERQMVRQLLAALLGWAGGCQQSQVYTIPTTTTTAAAAMLLFYRSNHWCCC